MQTDPAAKLSIPRTEYIASLAVVIIPFIGLIVAIYSFWGWGVTPIDIGILLVMYAISGFGITIGYHRLFTHRSFETTRFLRKVFAIMGSTAIQGPVLRWVATHRSHHQHSDCEDDPHSPNHHGGGVWGVLKGWWHAHVGWMFLDPKIDFPKYVRDFEDDHDIRKVSDQFGLWMLVGLIVPTIAGGLLTQSWTGVLLGFLWGGAVRIFLVHHVTFSINSICHLWGSRPYRTTDLSRNNAIFGILAFGEGWHNNHHAFPRSARHGLRWWQFDSSYCIIVMMKWLGLAWDINLPDEERSEAKRSAQRKDVVPNEVTQPNIVP
ncbi:MAG: acyl-CoA desaturase, partial [Phycisphaerae bacterium]